MFKIQTMPPSTRLSENNNNKNISARGPLCLKKIGTQARRKELRDDIAFCHHIPPCSAKSQTNSDGKLVFTAKYHLQEFSYHIIQTWKIPERHSLKKKDKCNLEGIMRRDHKTNDLSRQNQFLTGHCPLTGIKNFLKLHPVGNHVMYIRKMQ